MADFSIKCDAPNIMKYLNSKFQKFKINEIRETTNETNESTKFVIIRSIFVEEFLFSCWSWGSESFVMWRSQFDLGLISNSWFNITWKLCIKCQVCFNIFIYYYFISCKLFIFFGFMVIFLIFLLISSYFLCFNCLFLESFRN